MLDLTFTVTAGPVDGAYPAGGDYGLTAHPAFKLPGGNPALFIPAGFGIGDYYMLAADASGELVYEPGPNTRVFYFTRGGNGYTKQEIATAESVSLGTITNTWLNAQSVYGFATTHPLDFDDWTYSVVTEWTAANAAQGVWLMHERGYDYSALGDFPASDEERGFSPLHPTRYGAWGTGAHPILNTPGWTGGSGGPHLREKIAFSGVTFQASGGFVIAHGGGSNTQKYHIFDRVLIDTESYGMTLQGSPSVKIEYITFYKTKIEDCYRLVPYDGSLPWAVGTEDRTSGVFCNNTVHFLMMRTWLDHNGWADDYASTAASGGMPPTEFSHNLYNADSVQQTTLRDVVSVRAAMSAAQLRSGSHCYGFIGSENNTFHQVAGSAVSTNIYTFEHGSICAGGATKDSYAAVNYAKAWYFDAGSGTQDYTITKSMAVNAADPLNAAEVTEKSAYTSIDRFIGIPHYNDTVVANWLQLADQNAGSISAQVQNTMTMGQWLDARQVVSAGTNTTDAALDFLRAQDEPWNYVAEIQRYFWDLAGFSYSTRTTAAAITFTPWRQGEGWRWDNPMNWSSEDRPGVDVEGDNVSLNGETVRTYEPRCILGELELGSSGTLYVYGGKTSATNFAGTGTINISGAGQFWLQTIGTGAKTVAISDGRLGVNGTASGALTVTVANYGEVLVLGGHSLEMDSLTITGGNCLVGFDDDGGLAASLTVNGTLAFVASGGAVSTIEGYRSGYFGLTGAGVPVASSVAGSVILASGSVVTVNTTGLTAGTYILAENVTNNGATLPGGVTVNGSNQLQVVV